MKNTKFESNGKSSYFLPPEWAPQSAVMLTWPHAESDWAPWLTQVEREFVSMVRAITASENLLISCLNTSVLSHVSELLLKAEINLSRVRTYVIASDDTWVRDHGPLTVLDGNGCLRLLDFTFNGWGGKFSAEKDNQLTKALHEKGAFGGLALERVPLVLEGGGIEVDGEGTLLTTTSCLLAKTRNPHLSREELEEELKFLFGVNRFLWLEHGRLDGDDTDGHVDTLVRFTDASTLCYVSCDDPSDPHYENLKAMLLQLREFKDYRGESYKLVPLPWPKAKYSASGKRLPATYANFLIINGAVLVPTYDDPADELALSRLRGCFPDREIIGITCRTLIEQYGSLHCVTMQLPLGVIP